MFDTMWLVIRFHPTNRTNCILKPILGQNRVGQEHGNAHAVVFRGSEELRGVAVDC
jgi:hypothetical protein